MTYLLEWADLGVWHWVQIMLMAVAAITPIVWSLVNRASVALGMVLSILLVYLVEMFGLGVSWIIGAEDVYFATPIDLFAVIPTAQLDSDVTQWHRYFTAMWIHSPGLSLGAALHVLGNSLVIGFAGVPLEQRLGSRRWLSIYLIGGLVANFAWVFAHPSSAGRAWGASGAAFGLLGAYIACWPGDRIEFPLLLIRKWPVSFIALFELGVEIIHVTQQYGGIQGADGVAHLAHVGGFFGGYVLSRPIAKGGPTPLEKKDSGPSVHDVKGARRSEVKRRMASLAQDPWKESGVSIDERTSEVFSKLRESGDEPELREAWLENLSKLVNCPVCDSEVELITHKDVPSLECSKDANHLHWP